MRTKLGAVIVAGLVALALTPAVAEAGGGKPVIVHCGSQPVDAQDSQFDGHVHSAWAGWQDFVNDAWYRFGMNLDGNWTYGDLGYPNVDDVSRGLGRTFNALAMLGYGATPTPSCDGGPDARSAYCWAGNAMDELQGSCDDPATEIAHSAWGPAIDNYTELYLKFYFDHTVVERASILVHEARHAEWCGHNADRCPAGASCDYSWSVGCSGFPNDAGAGANAYQVYYLMTLGRYGTPAYTTSISRKNAFDFANVVMDNFFVLPPCWRLTADGAYTSYAGLCGG